MDVNTVGIDLAKEIFQIHGVDEHGKWLFNRQLNSCLNRDIAVSASERR